MWWEEDNEDAQDSCTLVCSQAAPGGPRRQKTWNPFLSCWNGKWEMLFNETRRLLAFENVHIMPVLGMMRDGDFWALVMPRMDHDLQKQSRLSTG